VKFGGGVNGIEGSDLKGKVSYGGRNLMGVGKLLN
jgi:hypothetical protein